MSTYILLSFEFLQQPQYFIFLIDNDRVRKTVKLTYWLEKCRSISEDRQWKKIYPTFLNVLLSEYASNIGFELNTQTRHAFRDTGRFETSVFKCGMLRFWEYILKKHFYYHVWLSTILFLKSWNKTLENVYSAKLLLYIVIKHNNRNNSLLQQIVHLW